MKRARVIQTSGQRSDDRLPDARYDPATDAIVIKPANVLGSYTVELVDEPPAPKEIIRAAILWNTASLRNAMDCTPENSIKASDAWEELKRAVGYWS